MGPRTVISTAQLTSSLSRVGSGWLTDHDNRLRLICASIGLLAAVLLILHCPLLFTGLNSSEIWVEDRFLEYGNVISRFGGKSGQQQDVILVTLDDESVRALGSYPLPRQMYAYLCKAMEEAGADVVGFTMILHGPSPAFQNGAGVSPKLSQYVKRTFNQELLNDASQDDNYLVSQFKQCSDVVLAAEVDPNLSLGAPKHEVSFQAPYSKLADALGGTPACVGNVSIIPDADGVVRRVNLSRSHLPAVIAPCESFPVKVASKKLMTPTSESEGMVRIGEKAFPREFRINYAGPAGTVASVPLWKALEWRKYYAPMVDSQPIDQLLTNPFLHKAVIVGYDDTTREALSNEQSGRNSERGSASFATPNGGNEKPMSLPEIEANVVLNLLSGNFVKELSNGQQATILFLLGFVCGQMFLGTRSNVMQPVSVLSMFSLFWMLFCFACFLCTNTMLPVVLPICSVVLPCGLYVIIDDKFIVQQIRRRQTRLFRKVASGETARLIDEQPMADLALAGKLAPITVLVCEIQNLSAIVAQFPPETAIKSIEMNLSEVSRCVTEYGGIIERKLNHGIVAIWGAPVKMPEEEQVFQAANCALALESRLVRLALGTDGEIPSVPEPAAAEAATNPYLDTFSNGGSAEESPSNQPLIPLLSVGINTGEALCGLVGDEANPTYVAIGETVDTAQQLSVTNRTYSTKCLLSASSAMLIGGRFATREIGALLGEERSDKAIFELLAPEGRLSGLLEEATSLYRLAMQATAEGDIEEAERLLQAALRMVPFDGPTRIALKRCKQHRESSVTADGGIL